MKLMIMQARAEANDIQQIPPARSVMTTDQVERGEQC